jgi:competence protein ComEC
LRLREPLIPPSLCLAAGIVVAHFHPFRPRFAPWAGIAGIAFGLAILGYFRGIGLRTHIAAGIAFLLAGMALAAAHTPPKPPVLSVPDNSLAIFQGCVTDPALIGADRERFGLELAPHARAQVSLYAKPGESFPALPYGTVIELTGKARSPHNYQNPGEFDYVGYLAHESIYWNISAEASTVHVFPGHCGNPLAGYIFGLRAAALERLDKLYPNDAYANGMMQAILIGATAKLDKMWTEDYRATGTFHTLVISGTHLAILAAAFLFFLRVCGVPANAATWATILAAWLYAGIAGAGSPVLRSAAGMTLYGIARCFYREGRILNILAAVAILFLALDPVQVFDSSFQLTFLAVGLIGAFVVPVLAATSEPLARGLKGLNDRGRDLRLPARTAQFRVELRLIVDTLALICGPRSKKAAQILVIALARVCFYLWDISVASLFIQIGLALPMIVYFHRLPVSGLTANALSVPALSALLPLGFVTILTESHTLAAICAWLLEFSRRVVSFHARWEPDWRIPAPPVWLGAVFVIFLFAAAWRGKHRIVRTLALTAVAAALAAIVIHPFPPAIQPGHLELSAIDVGQGDSLLSVFPSGQTMLIDAGGIAAFGRATKPGIDIGEDVVSPYLWSRSIKHLDIVAMTHAHEDHMGGMAAVLKNFHPGELWIGAAGNSPEWRDLHKTADELHIPIRALRQSDPFPYGGAAIQVLAPLPDYVPGDKAENNDSLVLRVQFGATAFLLTGDMEKKIEEELFDQGLLRGVDVLKVGHHGSRTSSTPDLLDAVHPAFGLISVGFDNAYGHPHPQTIAALETRNVAVYRTDENGLVSAVSDGRGVRVTSFTAPEQPSARRMVAAR